MAEGFVAPLKPGDTGGRTERWPDSVREAAENQAIGDGSRNAEYG